MSKVGIAARDAMTIGEALFHAFTKALHFLVADSDLAA
jgi:hypothetical protein